MESFFLPHVPQAESSASRGPDDLLTEANRVPLGPRPKSPEGTPPVQEAPASKPAVPAKVQETSEVGAAQTAGQAVSAAPPQPAELADMEVVEVEEEPVPQSSCVSKTAPVSISPAAVPAAAPTRPWRARPPTAQPTRRGAGNTSNPAAPTAMPPGKSLPVRPPQAKPPAVPKFLPRPKFEPRLGKAAGWRPRELQGWCNCWCLLAGRLLTNN